MITCRLRSENLQLTPGDFPTAFFSALFDAEKERALIDDLFQLELLSKRMREDFLPLKSQQIIFQLLSRRTFARSFIGSAI